MQRHPCKILQINLRNSLKVKQTITDTLFDSNDYSHFLVKIRRASLRTIPSRTKCTTFMVISQGSVNTKINLYECFSFFFNFQFSIVHDYKKARKWIRIRYMSKKRSCKETLHSGMLDLNSSTFPLNRTTGSRDWLRLIVISPLLSFYRQSSISIVVILSSKVCEGFHIRTSRSLKQIDNQYSL